jgi:hypothetical protein
MLPRVFSLKNREVEAVPKRLAPLPVFHHFLRRVLPRAMALGPGKVNDRIVHLT